MPARLSDEIDTSIPANNVPVEKSDLRNNTVAIKNAIAAVERRSDLPYQIMIGLQAVTS